jgi:hydrogenase expression/formation protein HypC
MCLAIPTRLIDKNGDEGVVEIGGVKKKISLALVPEAKVGDFVILHVGFAIQVMDENEAMETLELINEMIDIDSGFDKGEA